MTIVWLLFGSLESPWHAVSDDHLGAALCGEPYDACLEGPLPLPRSPRCPTCAHAALNLQEAAEGKIHLFNVVLQYDVYILAKSRDAALNQVVKLVQRGERPADQTVYTIANLRDVRPDWRAQQPYAAPDVTDEGYAVFGEATTEEIFKTLYTRS